MVEQYIIGGVSHLFGSGPDMIDSARRLRRAAFCLCVVLGITATSSAVEDQSRQSCKDHHIPSRTPDKVPSIRLAWDPSIPGGKTPQDKVAGYNILRHQPGDACERAPQTCPLINHGLVFGTACTDYAVQRGHTYIYQAQGVSEAKISSKLSNSAKATPR